MQHTHRNWKFEMKAEIKTMKRTQECYIVKWKKELYPPFICCVIFSTRWLWATPWHTWPVYINYACARLGCCVTWLPGPGWVKAAHDRSRFSACHTPSSIRMLRDVAGRWKMPPSPTQPRNAECPNTCRKQRNRPWLTLPSNRMAQWRKIQLRQSWPRHWM